jgi:hypothetical protein
LAPTLCIEMDVVLQDKFLVTVEERVEGAVDKAIFKHFEQPDQKLKKKRKKALDDVCKSAKVVFRIGAL